MIIILINGTYTGLGNKDMDFSGKDISMAAENGPDNTIIYLQGNGRAFIFQSGETRSAVNGSR